MQVEADFEVVVAQVQDMALRRGLFVAYMPLVEAWTVNDPAAGGKMLLYDAEIERLIEFLDGYAVVNVLPADFDGELAVIHNPQFNPAKRRPV